MADKFNKYKYIIVCAISLVIGIFLFGTKHPESSILFFVPVWIIFVIKDYYKNKYTNKILVKSRLLCKMLYNVFTISTYQN